MCNVPGSRKRSAVPVLHSQWHALVDGLALEVAQTRGSKRMLLERGATCFAYLSSAVSLSRRLGSCLVSPANCATSCSIARESFRCVPASGLVEQGSGRRLRTAAVVQASVRLTVRIPSEGVLNSIRQERC